MPISPHSAAPRHCVVSLHVSPSVMPCCSSALGSQAPACRTACRQGAWVRSWPQAPAAEQEHKEKSRGFGFFTCADFSSKSFSRLAISSKSFCVLTSSPFQFMLVSMPLRGKVSTHTAPAASRPEFMLQHETSSPDMRQHLRLHPTQTASELIAPQSSFAACLFASPVANAGCRRYLTHISGRNSCLQLSGPVKLLLQFDRLLRVETCSMHSSLGPSRRSMRAFRWASRSCSTPNGVVA